jgi:HEAT repeat protein
LQLLRSPDECARRDAAMDLGRMRTDRAVDPLTATLAGDHSPVVRDAAARALGLIAAPRSLTALIRAAQADNDRDVRHSAQFAVEIIRTNLKN